MDHSLTTKPSTSVCWFHSDVWVIGEATHRHLWDPTPLAKQHLSEGLVEAKRMEKSEGVLSFCHRSPNSWLIKSVIKLTYFSFFPHQVDWPKAFIFSLSLDEFQELGELTQHFKSLHYASSTIAAASWLMFLGLYLYYPLEVTLKSTELCLFLQQRLVSSRKVGAKGYEQNSEVC